MTTRTALRSTLFALTLFATTTAFAADPAARLQAPAADAAAAQWTAFSENLVHALQSGHDGLQRGALRMIIQHGDRVNVDAAVFDVVRIYRDHDDDNMRRMAVVALGQMDHAWATDFLKRSERFEHSSTIRHTIAAVVNAGK